MKLVALSVLFATFVLRCSAVGGAEVAEGQSWSDETVTMADVINQYRREKGLSAIPVSASLTAVAQAHVNDLQFANAVGGSCNLHSWSSQGGWSGCCYTSDHARADCMWSKPSEITEGVYSGKGYEISAVYSGTMTVEQALDSWLGSKSHREVILNKNQWRKMEWKAIGGAVSENYAVVWFGEELDRSASQ